MQTKNLSFIYLVIITINCFCLPVVHAISAKEVAEYLSQQTTPPFNFLAKFAQDPKHVIIEKQVIEVDVKEIVDLLYKQGVRFTDCLRAPLAVYCFGHKQHFAPTIKLHALTVAIMFKNQFFIHFMLENKDEYQEIQSFFEATQKPLSLTKMGEISQRKIRED